MGFERVYITKQGALLAAKTLQGKKIEFDHAEIGSGNLSGNAVDKTHRQKYLLYLKILMPKVLFILEKLDYLQ